MVQRVASLESGGHLLVERQCEVNKRLQIPWADRNRPRSCYSPRAAVW